MKQTEPARRRRTPATPDRIEDPWEMMVYRELRRAALAGIACPTADDLSALIGSESPATTVNIIARLERCGLIGVKRFQRSRQIYVPEVDAWTRAPVNEAPHWRQIAVTISALRRQRPDEALELARAAEQEGVGISEMLARCVWAGLRALQQAQGR